MLAIAGTVDPALVAGALRARDLLRQGLLAGRDDQGVWRGAPEGSPLATAAAVAALVLAEQDSGASLAAADRVDPFDSAYQGDLSELLVSSLHWLAERQNENGGWSDAPGAPSDPVSTAVVLCAFRLTGVPARYADLDPRAEQFLKVRGGVAALRRRHEQDPSVVLPVLTLSALAGLIPWRSVPPIRFELAHAPRWARRWLGDAAPPPRSPAVIAAGLAQQRRSPPRNPLVRLWRRRRFDQGVQRVAALQAPNGSFFQATGHTALVVACLAASGLGERRVVRRGVDRLLETVRGDGSWPLIADLAVRDTARSARATASPAGPLADWLLGHQHAGADAFVDHAPGGWAWTDAQGAPATTIDTACVMRALAEWAPQATGERRAKILGGLERGAAWVCRTQREDGGWPLLGDEVAGRLHAQSDVEMTTLAVEALADAMPHLPDPTASRAALHRAQQWLEERGQSDEGWRPLWMATPRQQGRPEGLAGAAIALRGLARLADALGTPADSPSIRHGIASVLAKRRRQPAPDDGSGVGSLEELCACIDALLPFAATDRHARRAVEEDARWLVEALAKDPSPHPTLYRLHIARRWLADRLHLPTALATTLDNFARFAAICQEPPPGVTPRAPVPS